MAFPFLNSCIFTSKEVNGNYQIVNEKLAVSDYDEIVLDLPANVVYRQISQDEPFLQVSVDENILPSLKIAVEGRKLVITQNNDSNLRPTQFTIYTNSKNLQKVNVTGSGDVLLKQQVNAQNMEIRITGSGSVQTDSLYCETIDVSITGSGDVELKGAANRARFDITGSGNIKALDYLVQQADCEITGSGKISTYVYKSIDASISGSGNIRYKGNPETVNKQVNGSGEITTL
jgi:hypothetical protein